MERKLIRDDKVVEFHSEEVATNVYSRCGFKSDLVKAKKKQPLNAMTKGTSGWINDNIPTAYI